MAAFLWVSDSHPSHLRSRALDIFRSQTGEDIAHRDAVGDLFVASSVSGDDRDRVTNSSKQFRAFTGTPFALDGADNLIRRLSNSARTEIELQGGFCILSCDSHQLCIQTDLMGQQYVYRATDNSIISTCYLAVLAGLPKTTLNPQTLYEYVFFGSTYGGETLVREIELLGAGERVEITRENVASKAPPPLPELPFDGSFAEAVDRVADSVLEVVSSVTRNFKKIDTALSAGFDTRLILAALRASGARNFKLHVYGSDTSSDVLLAKKICGGEGLPLEHRNKQDALHDPAVGWKKALETNCLMFDGLPPDGIVDSGSDLATRLERATGGSVSLNGGCGEILRNFFYLPDGEMKCTHLFDSFYRRYAASTVSSQFSEEIFREKFCEKILTAIGRSGDSSAKLRRSDIERVYPLFRGRYWASRNTSINLRLGQAVLPFLTPTLVQLAAGIPMKYKEFGRLEAAVIAKIDPVLARYPSDYGFDFFSGPTLKYRLKALTSIRRPIWLRSVSYRLQYRQLPPAVALDFLPENIRRFPILGRFFKPGSMRDFSQLKRLVSAEYLANRFDVRAHVNE